MFILSMIRCGCFPIQARGFLKSFDVNSKLVSNEFSSVAGNCDLLKDPKIACLHRQDRFVALLL